MQPKNYGRRIRKYATTILQVPSTPAARRSEAMGLLDAVTGAQHFLLPDGGVLLEDNQYRALPEGALLRLPYQKVALEFSVGSKHPVVVVARESDEDDSLLLTTLIGVADGSWIARHSCMARQAESAMSYTAAGRRQLHFRVASVSEDPVPTASQIAPAIVLSFLNALACSNVTHAELTPHKLGKTRKLPLPFDTYRVLLVDCNPAPGMRRQGPASPYSTRSPREHLRRGHIVCPTGRKPYWRNATIVNAGKGGKVTKDYALTARSTRTAPALLP